MADGFEGSERERMSFRVRLLEALEIPVVVAATERSDGW
jgi:hypothetical protein